METVRGLGTEAPTGLFFYEQTAEAIRYAVHRFEEDGVFSTSDCRRNAEAFSPERFRREFGQFLTARRAEHERRVKG